MMLKTAQEFGLGSEKTLKVSQELDELIVKHQRIQNLEGMMQHEDCFDCG
ncbi:aspartyl-phosphate phosphatase Spo0E family protein [Lentibacillus cibarius]|uniref:Aspartyl-phosphate phosphatase Spo0E family protein n=2 Tax=Lentibacillus cibarius TaxID=2583219 RepID=A0A549YMQ7_9BACI|nr:aspartyl-phosphate phosphatase Spo0E family protein [Lentibacillus cibarius]